MREIQLTLEFHGSTANAYAFAVTTDREPSHEGERNLADELYIELRKGIELHAHYDSLPDVSQLVIDTPRRLEGNVHTSLNKQALWLEIANTAIEARYLLSTAMAYKRIEPEWNENDARSQQQLFYAHFEKMYAFNLAMLDIMKLQDLVLRLVYEAFDGRLTFKGRDGKPFEIDTADPEWERTLTMKQIKGALNRKTQQQGICTAIVRLLEQPSKSPHVSPAVDYRNRLVHRLRPSVDYPRLYPLVHDRRGVPIIDDAGREIGRRISVGAVSTVADFKFERLYESTAAFFAEVVAALRVLKDIPLLA